MNGHIFRNAITETDGKNVNVGYLWLFYLGWLDTGLSVVFVGAGFWSMYYDSYHAYPFQQVAYALGAVWGTYSTALGALGIFLWGDRRPMPPGVTTVVQTGSTVTTTTPARPTRPLPPLPSGNVDDPDARPLG